MEPEERKPLCNLHNGRFTVHIEDSAPIEVSSKEERCLTGLSLDGRHLVEIRSNDRPYVSFQFSISNLGTPRGVLGYKSGYGSWTLDPREAPAEAPPASDPGVSP